MQQPTNCFLCNLCGVVWHLLLLLCLRAQRIEAPLKRARRLVRKQGEKEKAMDSFLQLATVAGAIVAAIGLALGLEWLGLNTLMHLMPAARRNSHANPGK